MQNTMLEGIRHYRAETLSITLAKRWTMPSAQPIIFLSYAKEDRRRILNIYRALRNARLNPWMDQPPRPWQRDGILPGQDWDTEIRRRIREAAVVLVFLSRKSLIKRGYVQREYRLALHTTLECPPGSISLVPVLLEPCDVPDLCVDTVSLRQFHWHLQYRSTIDELVTLVSHLVAHTPIEFPTPSPGGGATEARGLFAIVESAGSDTGALAGALANCVTAILRGDLEQALRASWSVELEQTSLDFSKATQALSQVTDPAIATGCALVLAGAYNRRHIPTRERATLQVWLKHDVPEVGAIAAMLLAQMKRPPAGVFDWLQSYADSPNRLIGGQALLRHLITPFSSIAQLAERAPSLMWQVFTNDPHLACMELRHASFQDSSSRFEVLARSEDPRTRETVAAIWSADDRVSIRNKLWLFEDLEPRVRFRALEGMLHATRSASDVKLIIEALARHPSTQSETRSLHVRALDKPSCVLVALDDSTSPHPQSASFWFSGMNCDVVEALDPFTFALRGFAAVGDYYRKVKEPFTWHYGADTPGWIQESLLAQRIMG